MLSVSNEMTVTMTTRTQAMRECIENATTQLNDAIEFEDWDIVQNVINDDLTPLLKGA